jgi:hypothetical protein
MKRTFGIAGVSRRKLGIATGVAMLSLAAAMLVVAAPATANSKPTTGTQIHLFAPPTMFPANTPFYIEQGFICDLGDASCIGGFISAQSGFTLYVDGVLQPSTVDVDVVGGGIEKRYLTNFPNGLPAGEHKFVGLHNADGTLVPVTASIDFTT